MCLRLLIDATRELPLGQLEPLFAESVAEGWHHLGLLHEEWQHGFNRFDRAGEAPYLAHEEKRVVALCGLNRDPYAGSPRIGRVRRLYVLAACRRQGVGRTLMACVILDARQSFAELLLRPDSAGAAAFFEAPGFEPRAALRRPRTGSCSPSGKTSRCPLPSLCSPC